jgi:AcrR family transcriptional regulator
MSPRPRRNEQQNNLQDVIKETAWRQITEAGATTLSLRAIARELGITAPAIYNYFPDRDALVTALIIDAYASFGDSQLAARDSIPAEDLIGRLVATGLAYRQWAHTYPQRYQLIFGTPIPGYHAPHETVMPIAARSMSALTSVVEAVRVAGRLKAKNFPVVTAAYLPAFEAWRQYGGDVDLLSLSVAVLIWAHVHGIVSLEISGNLPPFGVEGDALYMFEMVMLHERFIRPS